ncbi:MAG TPA: DUF4124 domain-containing protein [Steroidobacteraceae bacterium]|nr:DUF4124 domain-containing protein [Steroidobacteraceae bacterium]
MKAILTVTAALLVIGIAHAGDVFKLTDEKGNVIYTDRPNTLPAEKLDVKTQQTDSVEARKRYDSEMKAYGASDKAAPAKAASPQKAKELSADDKANRCIEARNQYQTVMNARRLYSQGETEGDRQYLTSEEIDAARANAKKVMDDFCAGQ